MLSFDGDGRTDRASLQDEVGDVHPYNRYSSVRSYFSLHVAAVETIADHSVTLNAPELRLDVQSYYLCTVYLF